MKLVRKVVTANLDYANNVAHMAMTRPAWSEALLAANVIGTLLGPVFGLSVGLATGAIVTAVAQKDVVCKRAKCPVFALKP